jgi:hypothetical protein
MAEVQISTFINNLLILGGKTACRETLGFPLSRILNHVYILSLGYTKKLTSHISVGGWVRALFPTKISAVMMYYIILVYCLVLKKPFVSAAGSTPPRPPQLH